MKTLLTILVLSSSASVFAANVAPTESAMDHGISAGALYSKVIKVKAGKYVYNVIGADLEEPACNSVQTVVTVEDDKLADTEGTTTVTYNLGTQVAGIVSAKASGNSVVIRARQNSAEDCTKSTIKTYVIRYPGKAGNLSLKSR